MRRRIGVITVCAGLALVVAMVRLLAPVPLEVLDRKLLDFRYLVRGPLAPSSHVVIVGIDEASLAEIGRWPWPRARLAAADRSSARRRGARDRPRHRARRAGDVGRPGRARDGAGGESAPHGGGAAPRLACGARRRCAARDRAAQGRRRGAGPLLRIRGRSGRAARDDAAPGDDGDAHGRCDPRHHARAQAWDPGARTDPGARGGDGGHGAHQLRARPGRIVSPGADRDSRGRSSRSVARPRAAPRVSRRGRCARDDHAGGCHRGPDR